MEIREKFPEFKLKISKELIEIIHYFHENNFEQKIIKSQTDKNGRMYILGEISL